MGKMMKIMIFALLAIGLVYFVVPLMTMTRLEVPSDGPVRAEEAAGDESDAATTSTANRSEKVLSDTIKVEAQSFQLVTTLASGIVREIKVSEGQNVEEGDALFVLDESDAKLSLKSAQVATAEKIAAHKIAELRAKTDERTAEERVKDAKSQVEASKAKVEATKRDAAASATRAADATVTASLELDRAEVRFERALRNYNQGCKFAGIKEIKAPNRGQIKIPRRPSVKNFDDKVMSFDEFIEAELGLREASVALEQSRLRVTSAEQAEKDGAYQKGYALEDAKRSQRAAQESLASVEAALEEIKLRVVQDVARSQASLDAAKHRETESQTRLERLTVRATRAGYIAGIFVEREKPVSAGSKMATLVPKTDLRARLYVPVGWDQTLRASLEGKAQGLVILAEAPSMHDENGNAVTFNAKVVSIAKNINDSAIAYLAVLEFNETGSDGASQLRHGMQIRLTLTRP